MTSAAWYLLYTGLPGNSACVDYAGYAGDIANTTAYWLYGISTVRVVEPAVSFTPWLSWSERNLVKNAHLPGIYLLAHWDNRPPSAVDPLAQAIVYIGETTDGSLMGRWQQFHRAAFEGKPGHSGGIAYNSAFGDGGETLYVAAFVPEGLSREMRALFIRYVERRLIWEWALRWDGPPVCNMK